MSRPDIEFLTHGIELTAPVDAALVCGNCGRPMQRLGLADHYQRRVDLDLCADCHLIWFDLTESARLGGPALLELIDRMATAQRLPHVSLRDDAHCPRCRGQLKTVHNLTRWGASLQLECLVGDGAYQSFAQFMQEKGLLRPMSRLDRARLLEKSGRIDCVNCGAAIGAADERCPYCQSVPSLLDVARLAHALDPEGILPLQPVQSVWPEQEAMQCAACGAALPPGQTLVCTQCGATLAISRLADAAARVDALGPALRAQALKPSPDVVKRRLAEIDPHLAQQREWAESMEAEARGEWRGLDEPIERRALFGGETHRWRTVLLGLAIWFAWWVWRR
jgi:hypothetical protein